jgi:ADP-ribosylglycohydrolase
LGYVLNRDEIIFIFQRAKTNKSNFQFTKESVTALSIQGGKHMSTSILNEQDYYRIVYGGWMGKNIGGTLGAPVEGKKELLRLDYYPELPDGPLENDDLDLQLVWLHALEQYGAGLTSRELGQEWLEHVLFPYDEYGYALTNLRRGLLPPVTGSFNNPFNHCMGSPIRSEIWAMVAPGAPSIAAYYAYQDAIVDHAGGEGVYGEMFFAALESAIFFERNRDRLIEIGLRYIPADCRVAKAVNDVVRWHQEGVDWIEARELVLTHHGDDNFTDAPQNIAFTILGWLYGNDFEDAILKAVNCGYDTDCTAATLGAILGMLLGVEQLPDRWVSPVGDRVVVSPQIKGFPAPANLDELTRRTIRMGKKVLAAMDANIQVHADWPTVWRHDTEAGNRTAELFSRSVTANRYLLPTGSSCSADLELEIEFGQDGPAIGASQSKQLNLVFMNRSCIALTGTLTIEPPNGWDAPSPYPFRLQPGESVRWQPTIRANDFPAPTNEIFICWTRTHDRATWAVSKVPVSLVRAARWQVTGPNEHTERTAYFSGHRLDLEKACGIRRDGTYKARSRFYNPTERPVRLIAACNGPVVLHLNGQPVIDCDETVEWMPAYHRAPRKQTCELVLPAGTHEVEVKAVRNGEPLKLYVLTVSPKETSEPGPYYYYTDIVWE